MRDNAIAVCGDKDSVLAFKAIGLDVFCVDDEYQARDTIHALARKYSVIFVTEKVALQAETFINRYKSRHRADTVGRGQQGRGACRHKSQRGKGDRRRHIIRQREQIRGRKWKLEKS